MYRDILDRLMAIPFVLLPLFVLGFLVWILFGIAYAAYQTHNYWTLVAIVLLVWAFCSAMHFSS